MHPNPIFHTESDSRNIAFARDRGFGILAVSGTQEPMLSHIPFRINDAGDAIDLHLVRSNPIARALKTPLPAKIAVSGADGYISPDWYGVEDQVPTWNYIAVHLSGSLERRPQDDMRDLLDRQSAHFENQLVPKPPWIIAKMSPDVLDRMMRQIVPFRMTIAAIEGTLKLNQNKADDVRLRAADHVDAFGIGRDTATLAALMRDADGQG